MSKLTAVQIRQAKPKDKPYKLPDGQGLYFHVAEKRQGRFRQRLGDDGRGCRGNVLKKSHPDRWREQLEKRAAVLERLIKAQDDSLTAW